MDFYTVNLRVEFLIENKWEEQFAEYTLFVIATNYDDACQKVNTAIIKNSSDTVKYTLNGEVSKINGVLQIKRNVLI